MHDPYLKVLRKRLPKAALVFDHFHVSKIVHDALDDIRRRLQRELPPAGRRIIKGQRYVLLRAREKLSRQQQVSLQEILDANTDLTKGYILKEAFRDVFKATNLPDGRKRLKAWEAPCRWQPPRRQLALPRGDAGRAPLHRAVPRPQPVAPEPAALNQSMGR